MLQPHSNGIEENAQHNSRFKDVRCGHAEEQGPQFEFHLTQGHSKNGNSSQVLELVLVLVLLRVLVLVLVLILIYNSNSADDLNSMSKATTKQPKQMHHFNYFSPLSDNWLHIFARGVI